MTVEQGPEMPPEEGGGADIGDAPWAADPQSRAACIDASLKDSQSKPAASVLDVLIRPLGARLTPTNFAIAEETPAPEDPPAVTPKAALALNLFGSAGFGGVEVQSVTWGGGHAEAMPPAGGDCGDDPSEEAPQCLADAEAPFCPIERLLAEGPGEVRPPDPEDGVVAPAEALEGPDFAGAYDEVLPDEDLLEGDPLDEEPFEEEGERFYDDLSPEELAVMIGGLNRGCDLGEIEEMLRGGATAPAGEAVAFEDVEPQEPETSPDAGSQCRPEAPVGTDSAPLEAEEIPDLALEIDPESAPLDATVMERDVPLADQAHPLDPAVDGPIEAGPVEEVTPPEEGHREAAAAPPEPSLDVVEDFGVQSFGLQRQGQPVDLNAGEPAVEVAAQADSQALDPAEDRSADPSSGSPAPSGGPAPRAAEPIELPGASQAVPAAEGAPPAWPVADMQRAVEAQMPEPGTVPEGAVGAPPPAAGEASSEAIVAEPSAAPDGDFAGILRSVEDSIAEPNAAVGHVEAAGPVTSGMQQSLIDEYVKQAKQEAAAAPVKPRKAQPRAVEPEKYSPPDLPSDRHRSDTEPSVPGSVGAEPPKDGRRLRQALQQSRARAENKKLSEKFRNMLGQD